MSDVVVSLSNNNLKVTFYGEEGLGTASTEISSDTAKGADILDVPKFTTILADVLSQVVPPKAKNVALNFLVEPKDAILEFATVPKNGKEVEDQVLSVISSKLEKGVVLENLYFSYQKIAPFVYQFIGVKKEFLESLLEVSTALGLELKSVTPWVLLLPKLVNDSKPSIFIFQDDKDKEVVALSELNGVYFVDVYKDKKTQEELEELVQKLSVYKRVVPISTIYTVNCNSFTLDPNYKVLPLDIAGGDLLDVKGYENHLLFSNVMASKPELFQTQVNLLTLLPVPAVEKSKLPVVPIGAALGAVLLVGILGYFVMFREAPVDTPEGESSEVLSEVAQSTESDQNVQQQDLKREDLQIRVENGSGVTGAAGKTRDFLQEKGYVILSIGDALESDRQDTLIKFKPDKVVYKDLMTSDMVDKYTVVVEEDLDENSAYDVLVIVGLDAEE